MRKSYTQPEIEQITVVAEGGFALSPEPGPDFTGTTPGVDGNGNGN